MIESHREIQVADALLIISADEQFEFFPARNGGKLSTCRASSAWA